MSDKKKEDKNPKKFPLNSYWIYGLIIFIILSMNVITLLGGKTDELSLNRFKDIAKKGHIDKVIVVNKEVARIYLKKEYLDKYPEFTESKFKLQQPHYTMNIGDVNLFYKMVDEDINTDPNKPLIDPKFVTETNYLSQILSWVIPFALIIGLWVFFMRRVGSGPGGPGAQIFNIGKSKATLFNNDDAQVSVTFKDVAGLEEAKEEVMEVVDFLKNPKKIYFTGR